MMANIHIDSFLELYEFAVGLIPQTPEDYQPASKDKAKPADKTYCSSKALYFVLLASFLNKIVNEMFKC